MRRNTGYKLGVNRCTRPAVKLGYDRSDIAGKRLTEVFGSCGSPQICPMTSKELGEAKVHGNVRALARPFLWRTLPYHHDGNPRTTNFVLPQETFGKIINAGHS